MAPHEVTWDVHVVVSAVWRMKLLAVFASIACSWYLWCMACWRVVFSSGFSVISRITLRAWLIDNADPQQILQVRQDFATTSICNDVIVLASSVCSILIIISPSLTQTSFLNLSTVYRGVDSLWWSRIIFSSSILHFWGFIFSHGSTNLVKCFLASMIYLV